MKVTLAVKHKQPRASRPERCDHCSGIDLEGGTVPVTTAPDSDVKLYNILVPGAGMQQFHLHESCAEELRQP